MERKNHKPYYVLDIDTKLNKVIVGPRDQLKKYYVYLKDLNFFSNKVPSKNLMHLLKSDQEKNLISAKIEVSNKLKNWYCSAIRT